MSETIATSREILVVGGGISGLSAALEAAECDQQVILMERNASLGGRVSQLYQYFPKLCVPTCGLEINYRRLRDNPRVRVMTMTEVAAVEGGPGAYRVTLRTQPRYVTTACTACGRCADAVESTFPDEFNYGLGERKGAYLPHPHAFPQRYVIDPRIVASGEAAKARDACPVNAVDLEETAQEQEVTVGAIVWATGWRPYDAARIQPYGYDRFPNVITNVEFERLADPRGPTGGRLLRPSDGEEARDIAFIQCAGSRDENHLRHCSRICCMASLKQTHYIRERGPEGAKSTIYYIDIRAIDRLDNFYRQVQADPQVHFIKSKVAQISAGEAGDLILNGVDTEGYHRYANRHDLVVLAVGMEPSMHGAEVLGEGLRVAEDGFVEAVGNAAIFPAGCAGDALDVNLAVQSATAGALRALQTVRRVAAAES